MLSSFSPQPILFSLGPLQIHWYGLIVALAAIAGYLVVLRLGKLIKLNKKDLADLFFYLLVFGFIGARIYEILFVDFDYYWQNPAQMIAVWNGGLAIHGGLIAGLLVLLVFVKKRNLNFWQMADLLSVGVILGQAIGRWGNFFNQELFGLPTDLPWKIFISPQNRPPEYLSYSFFHPTFLYESLLNFALFLFLYLLFRSRRLADGMVFIFYLLGYSLIRFFLEFIRLDPAPVVFGLRWPQIISIVIFLAGLFLLFVRKNNNQSKA